MPPLIDPAAVRPARPGCPKRRICRFQPAGARHHRRLAAVVSAPMSRSSAGQSRRSSPKRSPLKALGMSETVPAPDLASLRTSAVLEDDSASSASSGRKDVRRPGAPPRRRSSLTFCARTPDAPPSTGISVTGRPGRNTPGVVAPTVHVRLDLRAVIWISAVFACCGCPGEPGGSPAAARNWHDRRGSLGHERALLCR